MIQWYQLLLVIPIYPVDFDWKYQLFLVSFHSFQMTILTNYYKLITKRYQLLLVSFNNTIIRNSTNAAITYTQNSLEKKWYQLLLAIL